MATLQLEHSFKNGGVLTHLDDNLIRVERSQVAVDADGANGQKGLPPAYAPSSFHHPTLDNLGDGGRPGNWWALVTDNGHDDGEPILQVAGQPWPGAFISKTSLRLPRPDGSPFNRKDPMCYVDAATVPFLVICPELVSAVGPIVMGCRAVLINSLNNRRIEAVVADGGNSNEMGEISLAALQRLGIAGSARGVETTARLLTMEIYPGVAAVVDGITYPLQHS